MIGVRVPNWIGDVVISRGFLKALKEIYKDKIVIIGKNYVSSFFYDYEFFSFRSYLDYLRILKELKNRGLEKLYILAPSFSSAFFPFIAGIKERIGYDTDNRKLFLTKIFKKNLLKKEHLLVSYLRMVDVNSLHRKYFPELKLFDEFEEKTCVVAPFASFGPAKEWKFYKNLVKYLVDKGYKVYIVGKHRKDDFPEGSINLTGKTDILSLLKIISKSEYVFSNDSGVAHIGAAMGKKVFVFFGSSSPFWTKPLGEKVFVFYKKIFCSPCFERKCRYNTYECFEKIPPEEVKEIFEIISR